MSGPAEGGRRALALASIETFAGTMTSRALAFGLAIVTARLLGSETYGEFSIVQATALLLALALGQPLGVAINRFAAALWESEPSRSVRLVSSLISITVVIGGGFAIALAVASSPLAQGLFNRARLAPFLAAAGAAIALQAYFLVTTSTLRGFHEFRPAARAQILHALIGTPVALALVWRFGLWGAVAGLIAFWAIGSVISTAALGAVARRRSIRFSLTPRVDDLRVVAPFYLPYLITTVSAVSANWAARAILAQGEDAYRQVGLFSAAFQYAQVAQLIIAPLLLVATPVLTTAWSRSRSDQFHQLSADLFKISFLLLAPLAVLGVGWAPLLLTLLGGDYDAALRSMELLFPALAINALLALVGPVLIATGRVWLLARLALGRLGLLLVLMVLLRGGGAAGAALAFLVTELAVAGVLAVIARRRGLYEIIRLVHRIWWFSVPGLGLIVPSLWMSPVARGLTSVAAVAAVLLGALWALDRADRASLLGLVRRLGSGAGQGPSGGATGHGAR